MSLKRKGQISLAAIISGLGLLFAGVGTFFAQSTRIGGVETRAAVLEAQYVEMDKKLDEVRADVKTLLFKVDPQYKLQSNKTTSTKQ